MCTLNNTDFNLICLSTPYPPKHIGIAKPKTLHKFVHCYFFCVEYLIYEAPLWEISIKQTKINPNKTT